MELSTIWLKVDRKYYFELLDIENRLFLYVPFHCSMEGIGTHKWVTWNEELESESREGYDTCPDCMIKSRKQDVNLVLARAVVEPDNYMLIFIRGQLRCTLSTKHAAVTSQPDLPATASCQMALMTGFSAIASPGGASVSWNTVRRLLNAVSLNIHPARGKVLHLLKWIAIFFQNSMIVGDILIDHF